MLLLLGAGREQRFDSAIGQQRAQRERQVRRVQHFDARRGDQLGQALTIVLDGMQHALPAALAELAKRFLETGRSRDLAVLPCARILVAFEIQRRDHLAVEARGFFKYGLSRVETSVLETRQRCNAFDIG